MIVIRVRPIEAILALVDLQDEILEKKVIILGMEKHSALKEKKKLEAEIRDLNNKKIEIKKHLKEKMVMYHEKCSCGDMRVDLPKLKK